MIVVVNGKELEIEKKSTVDDLIKKFTLQNQRIALEVNEVIVPRSEYANFNLNQGDVCEIIKAVGGG